MESVRVCYRSFCGRIQFYIKLVFRRGHHHDRAGAIRLYGIPKAVIGENQTFLGDEEVLRASGVEIEVLRDEQRKA